MRASITPSHTPLWRTKAFPAPAELPPGSASSEPPATGAVPDLHFVASPPCHDVATKSLLTLPKQRASTQGQAEHEQRRLDELSWLSQVANGTRGAHLLHAQSAVSHVKGLLRNGSNALHDAQVPPHRAMELSEQAYYCVHTGLLKEVQRKTIPLTVAYNSRGEEVRKVSMAHYAMFAEPAIRLVGFGNCTLQACAAYSFLKRHLPPQTPVDICEVIGSDHVLVVIGRLPGSNPNDMNTWGPDAVVCDPWAGLTYPLSEYREMQRPERDVKRHIAAGSTEHYLSGRLRVRNEPVTLS